MTKSSAFPRLQSNQFALLVAEGLTGIVLDRNGNRALGNVEKYHVYESLEWARLSARNLVAANPLWECHIYDGAENRVETYRDEEALMVAARRGKKAKQ